MRILLDQGAPAPLRKHLGPHEVATAGELGWGTLKNGVLLSQAEAAGFDVLVTTDQNLKYQQKLSDRKIAILVLSTTSWPRIQRATALVSSALESFGTVLTPSCPFRDHARSFSSGPPGNCRCFVPGFQFRFIRLMA